MKSFFRFKNYVTPILLILIWAVGFFYYVLKSDMSVWMISTDHNSVFNNTTKKLLAGKSLTGQFSASDNNLGMILLHFKPTVDVADTLTFRLKQQGDTSWIVTSDHDKIGKMGFDYYPIGFTQITNSKDKVYQFELSVKNGTEGSSLELGSEGAEARTKYIINKDKVFYDPFSLVGFFWSKTIYALTHTLAFKDSLVFGLPFFAYLLFSLEYRFGFISKTLLRTLKIYLQTFEKSIKRKHKRFYSFYLSLKRRIQKTPSILIWIIGILSFSLLIKALIASLGFNADFESWRIVSSIVMNNEPIYSNTARYNYGPIWGYVTGLLGFLHQFLGYSGADFDSFHIIIALFLGIVDIGVAFFIVRLYGWIPGLLFFFNPVLFILTGSHSQFDNLAIFFGIISWFYFIKSQQSSSNKSYFLSALFLGLSLMTKHILLFFPLWLFLLKDTQNRSLKVKVIYTFIVYGLFFGGFAFEIVRFFSQRDEIIKGIITNVFMYRGYGGSAMVTVSSLLLPKYFIDLLPFAPLFKGFNFLYVVLITVYGFLAIRLQISLIHLFPIYLLVFFAFAPSEAPQYLMIPLIAVSILYRSVGSLIFLVSGFIYVCANYFTDMATLFNKPIDIFFTKIPFTPHFLFVVQNFEQMRSLYLLVQFWLIVSACLILYDRWKFVIPVEVNHKDIKVKKLNGAELVVADFRPFEYIRKFDWRHNIYLAVLLLFLLYSHFLILWYLLLKS